MPVNYNNMHFITDNFHELTEYGILGRTDIEITEIHFIRNHMHKLTSNTLIATPKLQI